jgi:hypothetical protein
MRADSALSHLYDNEACIVTMQDGTQREVRWSKQDWCFYLSRSDTSAVCRFEEIKEWRPASIKPA